MGLRHAMRTLGDEWDDIRNRLPGNEFVRLSELVSELVAEGVPATSVEIAEEIAELLGALLDEEHPFRRALAAPESRFVHGTGQGGATDLGDWLRPVDLLRQHVARSDPDAQPPPTAETVMGRATGRLLAASALSEAELRARGQDPGDADLIRLDRADGTGQWPAFQFGPDGAPLDLVRTINQILGVADDPWGVADWWLGPNSWLPSAPAQLIGRVDAQELIDAARAERSEG